MKQFIIGLFFLTYSGMSLAVPHENRLDMNHEVVKGTKSKNEPQIVKWTGVVKDEGSHTTKHNHSLEFVRKDNGESFDIVDSPDLEKLHCKTSKKLLIEVEAERTPKFLFWGDNLIVKNFKVIEELAMIPHKKYKKRTARTFHERR